MTPDTPLLKVMALLLDGFGLQGLLPAAMHYRWSYRAEQELFLQAEFGRGISTSSDRSERRAAGAKIMEYFSGMLPMLGVNPAGIPAIEAALDDLLEALDEHFQQFPYLLGGHPSIADFGFMAPLFAHLGRDPVPASRMKKRAPNVYRWVERMNLPGIVDPEFADVPPVWVTDDILPATLEPVLRLLFADWGPMLKADTASYNTWIAAQAGPLAGRLISHDGSRKVHPTTGMVRITWRGCDVVRASAPHGLWLLGRAQDALTASDTVARLRVESTLANLGGAEVMALRPVPPIRRENNVLIAG